MYSLVLMTAMATAPQSPEFNGYFRERWEQSTLFSGDRVRSLFSFGGGNCSGSCKGSCTGSCSGSCTGRSYSCSGSSCNGAAYAAGCCGGSAFGPLQAGGGLSYDSVPYAMPTPASFYDGPIASAGCFGSGGMNNPMPMGGFVPQGGFAPPAGAFDANPMGSGSLIPPPNVPFATPTPAPEVREYSPAPKNQLPLPSGALSPNRATVVVKLPADAKLYAEGRVLNLTGAERSFVTPELRPGQEYGYIFKVEYDRGGRTLSETQTIKVTPGRTSNLEFIDLLTTAGPSVPPRTNEVAIKSTAKGTPIANPVPVPMPTGGPERAKIIVKVPAGSTLFVDEKKNERSEAVREFNTPVLQPGKEYNYVMKIETVRNGFPEQVSQKVVFRAGDNLTVDFTTTGERNAAN